MTTIMASAVLLHLLLLLLLHLHSAPAFRAANGRELA